MELPPLKTRWPISRGCP